MLHSEFFEFDKILDLKVTQYGTIRYMYLEYIKKMLIYIQVIFIEIDAKFCQLGGVHKLLTLTIFCLFLTTYPPALTFSMV